MKEKCKHETIMIRSSGTMRIVPITDELAPEEGMLEHETVAALEWQRMHEEVKKEETR